MSLTWSDNSKTLVTKSQSMTKPSNYLDQHALKPSQIRYVALAICVAMGSLLLYECCVDSYQVGG